MNKGHGFALPLSTTAATKLLSQNNCALSNIRDVS
jgi:hypothetical protein